MTASVERTSQFLRNYKKTRPGYTWQIWYAFTYVSGENRDRMGWMGLAGARLTKINEIYMISDATLLY